MTKYPDEFLQSIYNLIKNKGFIASNVLFDVLLVKPVILLDF